MWCDDPTFLIPKYHILSQWVNEQTKDEEIIMSEELGSNKVSMRGCVETWYMLIDVPQILTVPYHRSNL